MSPQCAWCTEDAVGTVEVEPARHGLVQGVDKDTGQRVTARVMTKAPILANACASHAKMVNEQPQSMPRRRAKVDPGQLTIHDIA